MYITCNSQSLGNRLRVTDYLHRYLKLGFIKNPAFLAIVFIFIVFAEQIRYILFFYMLENIHVKKPLVGKFKVRDYW